jgi:hypothetical protein
MAAEGWYNRWTMTDEHLRQLVREALTRHLGHSGAASGDSAHPWKAHASHARVVLPVGADSGGPCLIEPAVGCTHCGYCQSWGH